NIAYIQNRRHGPCAGQTQRPQSAIRLRPSWADRQDPTLIWPVDGLACGLLLDGRNFLPFYWLVSVVLQLALVLDDLTVDLVCDKVNGCVEIFVDSLAMYVFAAQAHGDIGGMPEAFYREYDLCVDDIIEMSQHPCHLVQ